MKGWRKLAAWAAIFVLAAGATWFQKDVPANAESLLWGATLFFFGSNAIGKFSPAVREGTEPS